MRDILRSGQHAEWEYAWRIMTRERWVTLEERALWAAVKVRFAILASPYFLPRSTILVSVL